MRARTGPCVALALLGLLSPFARADVATFDSFYEGHSATTLVDGGITFTNLDRRLQDQVRPESFMIEDAANILWREPSFTPRNALGFGVYSPGEPVCFSRLGSLDIIPARPSSRIALHVYEYGDFTTCTISLTLTRAGEVVAQQTVPVVGSEGLSHYALDIDSPTFDAAHLSIGPGNEDYIFCLIDSVTIDDAMPCPTDWNHDWSVTSADFFAFLDDLFADRADFNADDVTDSRDFFEFLSRFFIGC